VFPGGSRFAIALHGVEAHNKQTDDRAMKKAPGTGRVGRVLSWGQITVDLHAEPLTYIPFGRTESRYGGALSTSLVTHVVLIALAVVIAARPVSRAMSEADVPPDLINAGIVWLAVPGPGGGGGGGGNRSPEPPRKAELPGKDRLTVPVLKPATMENLEPKKEEPTPPQWLNIPAQTLAAGDIVATGALEGVEGGLSLGSGSGGGAGTGTGSGIGSGTGSGLGPGWGGGTGGGAYRPGSGIELPRVVREIKPQYTADAMRAKIQGMVVLECVVQADGTVGNVRVVRSLDAVFGLDQEAVKAARQWLFVPGTRQGQPVAVLVTIELTFTLR
jgi:periplasmic protein TonB